MHDARFDKLAKLLVEYSTRLKRNENVLIEAFDVPDEMTIALMRAARKRGRDSICADSTGPGKSRAGDDASERQLNLAAQHELARMKKMDAYIAFRGSNNITEFSDVPAEQMRLVAKKMRPVQDQRVKKTKWVVLRWPTPSMAQLAGMSTEAFEDFYFDVCTLDYRKLQPGMKALKTLMEKTDRVEIKGPGTDLRFSIKGIPADDLRRRPQHPGWRGFQLPGARIRWKDTSLSTLPPFIKESRFDNIRLEFPRREDCQGDRQSNGEAEQDSRF